MSNERVYNACVVVIGNEVLSGRTRDANIGYLGGRLNELGIRLAEARVIPDDEAVVIDTVNFCRGVFDYVFTTGGIGPTHDDITAAAIARAFDVTLERNPEAEALLRRHYRPEDLNEARLTMADIPAGAGLIENPVSKAPGFQIENVFVLAGVPRIMQAQFECLKDRLAGGRPMRSKTISAYITEGELAARLGAIQESHPEVEIGSYPFVRDGKLGVSLVIRGPESDSIAAAAEGIREAIRARGGAPIEDEEV